MTMSSTAPAAERSVGQSAVTRKRRRRAPTATAAEDCFSCQKEHTTCDRRRPYCTQCLDAGKDCSGYKTRLTWGVGVASRGKLRGMTLPVLKTDEALPPTPRIQGPSSCPDRVARSHPRQPSFGPSSGPEWQDMGSTNYTAMHYAESNGSESPLPSSAISIPMAGGVTQPILQAPYMSPGHHHEMHRPAVQPLNLSMGYSLDDLEPPPGSASSWTAFSDSGFPSPSEFSQHGDELLLDTPLSSYTDVYPTPTSHFYSTSTSSYASSRLPTSCPSQDLPTPGFYPDVTYDQSCYDSNLRHYGSLPVSEAHGQPLVAHAGGHRTP